MSHVPSDASDSGSASATGRTTADSAKISDLNQNVWTLHRQDIVSVPRRNNVTPVTIYSIPCKYSLPSKQNSRFPIYLGIKNPEKCLCCEKIKGKPTLQLKDKKILDLYNAPAPVLNFLFYRNQTGSTSTFESVVFPGWFIASSDKGQPLFLTSNPAGAENTAFIYNASQ
ncbi:interleukin-36 gamma-like [Suncus etruscus]|uniref:interleukin-36 gamma-like n=1 Tax=Suncus etruscus TaxID=109475 RepID=UPI00211001DE|nr:interleukin-36 gamma-like [Suncus etruscus]